MFFEELRNAPVGPESGRIGRAIEAARAAGTEPPGLYYLFAHRPAAARALGAFMQEVMRGPSDLSPGQRELIAAWTSGRNHCAF